LLLFSWYERKSIGSIGRFSRFSRRKISCKFALIAYHCNYEETVLFIPRFNFLSFGTMMEQTLVILKPDAVRRGLMGEILQRFERAGFRVVQMELRSPEATQFYRHYEEIGKLVSRR
jgi:hypothetical protein